VFTHGLSAVPFHEQSTHGLSAATLGPFRKQFNSYCYARSPLVTSIVSIVSLLEDQGVTREERARVTKGTYYCSGASLCYSLCLFLAASFLCSNIHESIFRRLETAAGPAPSHNHSQK
jgi:hypothetical protein